MNQVSSATVRTTTLQSAPSGTSSIQMVHEVRWVSPTEVMGRVVAEPIAPLALSSASAFTPLRMALSQFDWRTSVTRSGEVVLTFIKERRYAILTSDADGDLVLTLTDRTSTDEAEADVVTADTQTLAARIRGFLER